MELDWYGRATVNMMPSASTTSRWRTNVNVSDHERQASRWFSLLNLVHLARVGLSLSSKIQDRGIFSPRSSVDECSSPRSNFSSPKQSPRSPKPTGPQLSPQCARSLSGEGSLSSKSHVCFACVLHHHD